MAKTMTLDEFRAEGARLLALCEDAEIRCAGKPDDERLADEFETAVNAYMAHVAVKADVVAALRALVDREGVS